MCVVYFICDFFNYVLCCMCCVRLSCWIKITYLLTYQSLAVYLLMALPVGCGHHWTTVAVWTVTRHRTALTRFHDSLTSEISYDFCQIIWKQSSYWEEINGLNCSYASYSGIRCTMDSTTRCTTYCCATNPQHLNVLKVKCQNKTPAAVRSSTGPDLAGERPGPSLIVGHYMEDWNAGL